MSEVSTIAEEPTELELSRMIHCLGPDREVYSGRKFFEKMLAHDGKGLEGTLDFIRRSQKALLTQDGLDLHYNFDPIEREIFKKTYLKLWSRREFLNTVGWGVPGAVFAGYGVAGTAEQIDDLCTRGSALPEDWATSRLPRQVKEVILLGEPGAEILVGAALINEAFEKREEIKLEQIADAIDVLAKKLQMPIPLNGTSKSLSR